MAIVRSVVDAPAPIGALTLGVTPAGLALAAFGRRPEAAALAGERRRFDVPLDWSLTSGSQRTVLQTLRDTVPYGATVTYGELADRSGLGTAYTAARGVGSIMGSNPIPVVVPCHRVLGSDSL